MSWFQRVFGGDEPANPRLRLNDRFPVGRSSVTIAIEGEDSSVSVLLGDDYVSAVIARALARMLDIPHQGALAQVTLGYVSIVSWNPEDPRMVIKRV